ncbi:MAG: hypothetical protein M3Z26_16040 [Bacteroidota bacterium]|nr:hypothetical protein [Bacteroidota bacterium]
MAEGAFAQVTWIALEKAKTDSLTNVNYHQILQSLGIKLPVLPPLAEDPSTWALAEASRLRNDSDGMKLVGKQLEWVLAANPFRAKPDVWSRI